VRFREFLDVYRGYRTPHLNLVARRKQWFVLSGFLVAISLIGLIVVELNYSIDFRGGTQISYPLQAEASVADVRTTLEGFGYAEAQVQIVTAEEGQLVTIRTSELAAEDVTGGDDGAGSLREALAEQAGIDPVEVNIETIGPTWGNEISAKALRGLVIVLAGVSLYIWLRFRWEMAVGAMVALVHDLVVTAGVYALTGREVTPETVIAVLTILGFSLYDTVVIYDRVDENTESAALVARLGYDGVVNRSLNQVLMRSVTTSLVVLFPVGALLLYGGATLQAFAYAMFVGTLVGTYSSIFVAAPLLTIFHKETPVRGRRPRPSDEVAARGAASEQARTSDVAAVAATARQGGGSARPRPTSKRRPPAKRKRR
jgi:preprotein translocase subunit SecF